MIDLVKLVLDEWVGQGILVAVKMFPWVTPIVTPLKRDGITPRICGEYRITLNKHWLRRACTTLEIVDVVNKLKGAKWFSKIDVQNAFMQIPLPFGLSVSVNISTKSE